MTPPALANKVRSRIGSAARSDEAKNAVNRFATDLGRRFAQCMAGCQLVMVMGSGPVPSHAPPNVPVGSVINGTCSGGSIPTAAAFFQP